MKNIWITGASSGIGRALALKFAKEGWQVAASARRRNLLEEISRSNVSQLEDGACIKSRGLYIDIAEKKGIPRNNH